MPLSNIDFEGTENDVQKEPTVHIENNQQQEDVTHLNGNNQEDITGKDGNSKNNNPNQQVDNDIEGNKPKGTDTNNPSTGELVSGDELEFDGAVYTVSENGDIVDENGKVFKQANEVKDWLKSIEVEATQQDNSISLQSIQDALGTTIVDENGETVEFTNDAAGVQSYVNSVIELRSKELQEAAINRLYQDNPLLKQFQDYVQLTGTPKGFGDIPDRSGITLDKDNVYQLVSVIKMAAEEFGNKSLNDNYIKYLKDTGGLYDEAKNQLQALVEKDNNYRKDLEAKAEAQRREEAESISQYWNNVDNIIKGRIIAGYKIPESFTKEVDGRKVVMTANDFFKYVSQPTVTLPNGQKVTAYQAALNELSDNDYLNREMLDAWLMFTGGTYKDLIDMAVKEDAVRKLRVKSKEQRSNKTVKVIRKQTGKSSMDDIIL
uniref:Uncharacterized protein n=1 Tax=Geladintestivirus 2 TaxID=3233134 RepID=A0AAU8MKT8_9CAUD